MILSSIFSFPPHLHLSPKSKSQSTQSMPSLWVQYSTFAMSTRRSATQVLSSSPVSELQSVVTSQHMTCQIFETIPNMCFIVLFISIGFFTFLMFKRFCFSFSLFSLLMLCHSLGGPRHPERGRYLALKIETPVRSATETLILGIHFIHFASLF